jgi:hypothetical protein
MVGRPEGVARKRWIEAAMDFSAFSWGFSCTRRTPRAGEHAHGVFFHQLAQAVVHDGLVHLEQLRRLLEQAFVGEGAMAFALEFFERVQDARVDALRAGRRQAEVTRDLVRGLEADAFHLAADPVRARW